MGYWWFRVAEGLGILSRLSAYASVYPVCCIYGMPHGTQCECFLASALHCNLWNFVPLNSVRMLRGLCPAHPTRAWLTSVLLATVPPTPSFPEPGSYVLLLISATLEHTSPVVTASDYLLVTASDCVCTCYSCGHSYLLQLCAPSCPCRGCMQVGVLAKIESAASVENLEAILDAVDGAMVARGDLGAELAIEEVPYWQAKIVQGCRYGVMG